MPELIYKDPFIRIPQWHEKIPKEVEPYKYKPHSKPPIDPLNVPSIAEPGEQLSGYIDGKSASKLEERFAIALRFYGIQFQFQYEVPSVYSLPGQGKMIDFIVYDGGIAVPIEVGSAFVHGATSQKEAEKERTALINPVLSNLGILPFDDNSYLELDHPTSIEDAKRIVREKFFNI